MIRVQFCWIEIDFAEGKAVDGEIGEGIHNPHVEFVASGDIRGRIDQRRNQATNNAQ
jgi:hypothetical protein